MKSLAMERTTQFEHFFKPEARRSGSQFIKLNQVKVSYSSETQFQTYIKQFRVSLFLPDISGPTLVANCSCPLSAKGAFCKHIWATLLMAEIKMPGFFESVNTIEKSSRTDRSHDFQKKTKAKQAAYRKAQYARQKSWAKEKRKELKAKKSSQHVGAGNDFSIHQQAVLRALSFFSQNGFHFEKNFDLEELKAAKKKLSRVFHPDTGGSHDESVALNKNFEILVRYLNS